MDNNITESEINGQKENKWLRMKWFNFYFSWRIYLGLFFAVVYLGLIIYFGLSFSLWPTFVELSLFLLINMALLVILLIGFKKKKSWLYKYNVFMLALESFYVFSRAFDQENLNDPEMLLIATIIFGIAGFLWFFFNYRYFRKRKSFMFYVKKEKPPRRFFQFLTSGLKNTLVWSKKHSKLIIIALLVCLAIYLIIPKYYFLNIGSTLVKCNKITGKCEKWRSGSWQLLR